MELQTLSRKLNVYNKKNNIIRHVVTCHIIWMRSLETEKNKINAAELWLYRRLRIQWTEKRSNKSLFEEWTVKP